MIFVDPFYFFSYFSSGPEKMDQFFNNPGLSHIGRNILEELNLADLESTCTKVCKSWQIMLENPTFWLQTCMKNASKFHKAPPEVSDGLGTLKFGFEFFVP